MAQAPDKQFLNIRVTKAMHAAVKEFKHRQRLDSDAEAVRRILSDRLTAEGYLPASAPPAPD